jgi:hypothetical protein
LCATVNLPGLERPVGAGIAHRPTATPARQAGASGRRDRDTLGSAFIGCTALLTDNVRPQTITRSPGHRHRLRSRQS